MNAYIVCGPFASGNRLMAAILVRSGCRGSGSTDQPAGSGEIPQCDGRPYVMVQHHRLPYWAEALRECGYGHVAAIVMVREPIAQARSASRAHGKDFGLCYLDRTVTTATNVATAMRAGLQLEIVPYESLSEPMLAAWLPTIGLPYARGPIHTPGQTTAARIENQNRKHYATGETMPKELYDCPPSLVQRRGFWVREHNVDKDLVIVRDVYEEDTYRLRLIPRVVESAETVVDVGAHIGCFARLVHERNPRAKIICIEACPENLTALEKNVGHFATIVHAACSYEKGAPRLLNAVFPHCASTGGSIVSFPPHTFSPRGDTQYWLDERPLPVVTLEAVLDSLDTRPSTIDLLKLDCEGCEHSVLGRTTLLDSIRFIVGEYHGSARWNRLLARRFATWDYGHHYESGGLGIFHLRNPRPQ